jgi:predicted ATP-binding protein involved in virulence
MTEIFISHIKINNVRHLKGIEIPISTEKRKHLILTGKNGSGKTSVLNALKEFLKGITDKRFYAIQSSQAMKIICETEIKKLEKQLLSSINEEQKTDCLNKILNYKSELKKFENKLKPFEDIELSINNSAYVTDSYKNGDFVLTFFDAKRIKSVIPVTGFSKIDFPKAFVLDSNSNQYFTQYIVNLKAERSFANDDNDVETMKKIDDWFEKFESALKFLFDEKHLQLDFDRKNYNFNILLNNHQPFDFNTLSDGYSAIMTIVTELILRMEGKSSKVYDLQGIVLIDEIEAHLHIDLQKKILPFLAAFFPKIQFIVTSHSPFVLTSVQDAVVYDLEKQIRIEDLSGYSLDAVVESYFDSDQYSEVIKKQVEEYETLNKMDAKSEEQNMRYQFLKKYFKELPKAFSEELDYKIKQIELSGLK